MENSNINPKNQMQESHSKNESIECFEDCKAISGIVEKYQEANYGTSNTEYVKDIPNQNILFTQLKTSLEKGIDQSTIPERIEAFGTNELVIDNNPSFWDLFNDALNQTVSISIMTMALLLSLINLVTQENKIIGKYFQNNSFLSFARSGRSTTSHDRFGWYHSLE